jgi:hypothetical protein
MAQIKVRTAWQESLLHHVERGHSVASACRLTNISIGQVYTAIKNSPSFEVRLRAVLGDRASEMLKGLVTRVG